MCAQPVSCPTFSVYEFPFVPFEVTFLYAFMDFLLCVRIFSFPFKFTRSNRFVFSFSKQKSNKISKIRY